MDDLLSCPFCGGEAKVEQPYRNQAICKDCLARGPVKRPWENETPAETWNTRAAQPGQGGVDREAVAAALCRASPTHKPYHFPGDKPRKWDSPGGGRFWTHELGQRSAENLRQMADAAIASLSSPTVTQADDRPMSADAFIARLADDNGDIDDFDIRQALVDWSHGDWPGAMSVFTDAQEGNHASD